MKYYIYYCYTNGLEGAYVFYNKKEYSKMFNKIKNAAQLAHANKKGKAMSKYTDSGEFNMKCPFGHSWKAHMYFDKFQWKYTHEHTAKCPICGELATVAEVYLNKK